MKEIYHRRSIRQYKDEPISDEQIEQLLRSAMQAPSAGNQQSWEFIVVRDRDTLLKLSTSSQYGSVVKNASVAIVMIANEKKMIHKEYWIQDLSASAENMLLEAVSQGLGGVWIGIAPREERMASVSTIFNLPCYIKPFAIISLGIPKTQQAFVERYAPNKVHYETYKVETQ